MALKENKAQSTVEYIIVVSVIIAAMLFFAGQGGFFQTALNSTMDTNLNMMVNAADTIFTF